MEADKLNQYSQRSCLVISGVEPQPNKAIKSAEETEEKVRRIIKTNLDISRGDFDYELDKVDKLPPLNITCKLRTHCFREYLFAKKNDILNITNKKVNFYVSLTKCRSDLLHETNKYVSKNGN